MELDGLEEQQIPHSDIVHEFDVVPDGWTDDVHFSPSIGVPRLGLSLLKFNVETNILELIDIELTSLALY